jgi:ABC-type multidrug transport system permease subunit
VQDLAQLLPLTHMVTAARAVMLDGAGLMQILPDLAILTAFSLVFIAIGAKTFRWE